MSELAARREARRRKILNNSESRLSRITGRDSESEIDGLVDHGGTLNGSCIKRENDLSEFSSPRTHSAESYPQSYPASELSTENIPSRDHYDVPESTASKPVYHSGPSLYMTTAVLFRMFLEFSSNIVCSHNMIVAFLMIKCSSVALFGIESAEISPLVQGAVILSGISPQRVRFIATILNLLSSAIKHFSLFTFSFVLSDICINFCKSLH